MIQIFIARRKERKISYQDSLYLLLKPLCGFIDFGKPERIFWHFKKFFTDFCLFHLLEMKIIHWNCNKTVQNPRKTVSNKISTITAYFSPKKHFLSFWANLRISVFLITLAWKLSHKTILVTVQKRQKILKTQFC